MNNRYFAFMSRRMSAQAIVYVVFAVLALQPLATATARTTRLIPKPAPAAAAPQQKTSEAAGSSSTSLRDTGLGKERVAALDYLYRQLLAGEPFSHEEARILNNYKAGFEIDTLEADVVISRAIYEDLVLNAPLTRDQQVVYDEYRAWKGVQLYDIMDVKLQDVAERKAAWAENPRAPQVPPPNDLCAGAEVVPAAGPFPYLTATTADITDATTTGDPNIPTCAFAGGPVSRSIWYTFTPSTSGSFTFSTCADAPTGTTVNDTVLAVYTSAGGCAGPFTQIACDDDTCASEVLQSVVAATLTSGTTYYIVVWLYDTIAPTPSNTAVQLRVTAPAPVPANDLCSGAIPLTLNTSVNGTLAGAANNYTIGSPSATCFPGIGQTTTNAAPGRDVVYSFTPAVSGNYSFRMFSREAWAASAILYLEVGPNCPVVAPIVCSATMVGANRQSSTAAFSNVEEIYCAALTGGTIYNVFVDEVSLQMTAGAFTIEVFPCVRETEPNGTPATANALSCNLESAINPAGDIDFFSLGTPAAGSRVFAVSDGAAGNSTDQDMRITTTTDTLEYDDANNDVAFGSLSPNAAGTPLTGVASFIRMNHFTAGSTQEPQRLISVVQPPGAGLGGSSATAEIEPNDTTAQATSAANNFFSGSAASIVETDLFAFTAMAGEVIFLSLDGDPLRDNTPRNFALALLNSGGTVLLSVNDGGATSNTTSGAGTLTSGTPNSPGEALVFRAQTTGTYYARVTMPTGTGGTAADYLLSVARDCTIGGGIAPPCTITCPANVTVPESSPGSGSAVVNYPPPTTTGTCESIQCSPASGSSFPVGTTTVTCQEFIIGREDERGLASCSFTVTVTAGCAITCPANVTQANDANQCGAVVTYPAPTTTGTCGTVTCSPASTSFFPVGTTTVNCTSTAGPACSFTVTVNDTQAPTITCPANVTQGNDANQCGAVVTYAAPTVSDNCPGVGTPVCSPVSGSFFAVGTTTVTCTVSDASANSPDGTCMFTVTVNDTQAPAITCPANVTQANDLNQCGAVVNYPAPTVSDNCPGVGSPVCSPASGSFLPVGTTTVTCTVADGSANSPDATCMFTVTVNDTQAPAITCPANVIATGTVISGCTLSAVVTYPAPTVSDNCPGVGAPTCVPASGSTFPEGTTTVTCTVADAVGNMAACSFTVTVTAVGAFGACAVDDFSGDTWSIVTSPTSPIYGFWRYRVAATGELFCGTASALAYIPGRSLTASDTDDPRFFMNANLNYGARAGTVKVVDQATGRQFVLRDRNLSNNPPCQ